ncbi:MAG: DNA translocase FtsK 4TM domain-containing protein [Coprococcus comes]
MAASKTTKKRKKKTAQKQQPAENRFQTEILILVVLAACIILMISAFGMGGIVGNAISSISFGIMGMCAYLFPVVLFGGVAFLLVNSSNRLAYKKFFAGIVFFVFLCGLLQLLTEGYTPSTTFADYYSLSSEYHTGGGVFGGAICISTASAFGVAGGAVIIVLVLLVSLIIITQKSFFGFMNKILDLISGAVEEGREAYLEGQPDREKKKELRRKLRAEKRAEKIRLLEEELAEEELAMAGSVPETAGKKKFGKKSARAEKERQAAVKANRKGEFNLPSFLDEEKAELPAETDLTDKEKQEAEEKQPSHEVPLEFQIHRSTPAPQAFEEPEEPDFERDIQEDIPEDDYDGYEDADIPEMNQILPSEPVSAPEKRQSREDRAVSAGTKAADQEKAILTEEVSQQPSRNPKSSKAEIEHGIRNIQHEISQKELPEKKPYQYPPLKILKRGDGRSQGDSDAHLRKTAQKLQDTLHNFGVNVTVTNVSCGPTVTRYELQPEMGVKVSKIVGLSDDIKLNLATPDIRIEAPIPGKAAVGIEVPNKENSPVMLRDILQSDEFKNAKSKLSFAAGKDIAGKPVVADIAKMPHLLIAGATGSGKSVCINTLIISILYKATPDEVRLIMIDPKVVELSVYNGIPHLFIPVVTDPKKAAGALNWAVSEMTSRYNAFAEYGVRNLGEYNKKVANMRVPEGEKAPEKMPQIVIIVDELADLMMVAPGEVEDAICRLAQLARAAGIHLIIATQRPSVNVITGLIKANMPSRIAFSVSSGVDSRTILDMNGAEKLLGKGDMLFYPQGYQKPARLQGAFVSDEEVSAVVEYVSNKNQGAVYDTAIEKQVNTASAAGGAGGGDRDVYFTEAGKFIIEKEKASIGMLQRMFKIGFNRAARIMDQLCDAGVVGPEEGTKPRKVLMSAEEFENYLEENG